MPLSDAVTVTFCEVLTVPVVAAKVALLWFAATVTQSGRASCRERVLRETTVELLAVLFSETVQLLDALLPREAGEQDTELSCAGALPVSVNVWEAPLSVAVSNAV